MKAVKFIIVALVLAIATPAINAQGVWKRTKSWGLGYVSSTLKGDDGYKNSADFGVAMKIMNTYYLHKNPIGGFMKVGLDAVWTDFTYNKFKSMEGESSNVVDWDDDEMDESFNIGSHNLEVGMGIGPSLNFAPFYKFTNGLKDLRAGVYFHFTPTFSALLLKEGNETNGYYGFSPVFNLGLNLQWKMLGLGFEGRWSHPHYSNLAEKLLGEEYEESTNSHGSFSIDSFRVFVRLCF